MDYVVVLVVLALAALAGWRIYQNYVIETKESRTIRSLPPSVQHVIAAMDPAAQAAFFNEYERKKKKMWVGYLLWFLFGVHYLYTRKVGMQFLYWSTAGGFGIWMLVDFFRMPSIIRSANEQTAREALQTIHLANSFAGQAIPDQLTHMNVGLQQPRYEAGPVAAAPAPPAIRPGGPTSTAPAGPSTPPPSAPPPAVGMPLPAPEPIGSGNAAAASLEPRPAATESADGETAVAMPRISAPLLEARRSDDAVPLAQKYKGGDMKNGWLFDGAKWVDPNTGIPAA